jgi:hypothetical protein
MVWNGGGMVPYTPPLYVVRRTCTYVCVHFTRNATRPPKICVSECRHWRRGHVVAEPAHWKVDGRSAPHRVWTKRTREAALVVQAE